MSGRASTHLSRAGSTNLIQKAEGIITASIQDQTGYLYVRGEGWLEFMNQHMERLDTQALLLIHNNDKKTWDLSQASLFTELVP